jgi:hypothetical protein
MIGIARADSDDENFSQNPVSRAAAPINTTSKTESQRRSQYEC